MKEIKTYHFVIKIYQQSIITTYRQTEREAWADAYAAAYGKDAKYISMTLVCDTQYIKEEGEQ